MFSWTTARCLPHLRSFEKLEDLEVFWLANRFPFACESAESQAVFLRPGEWVFGPSKAAVVKTAMRWDEWGIRCEYQNYGNDEFIDGWLADLTIDRSKRIANGTWTEGDELKYTRRSSKRFPGCWRLTNLPNGLDAEDWLTNDFNVEGTLDDPRTPIGQVVTALQEATFDDWGEHNSQVLSFYDQYGVDRYIDYLREEAALGYAYP